MRGNRELLWWAIRSVLWDESWRIGGWGIPGRAGWGKGGGRVGILEGASQGCSEGRTCCNWRSGVRSWNFADTVKSVWRGWESWKKRGTAGWDGRSKGQRMDGEQELERFQEKWGTSWGCLGHKTLGRARRAWLLYGTIGRFSREVQES